MHVDIEPTQIGRVFGPDYGIVSDAGAALDRCSRWPARMKAAGTLRDRGAWAAECQERKRRAAAQDALRQRADEAAARVYEEMNAPSARTPATSARSARRRSPPRSSCIQAAPLDQLRPGRPARLDHPAALGVVRGRPGRKVVAISGDYDFQFMIEELAVGAQFKLPTSTCW